jgi:hypothetical protein
LDNDTWALRYHEAGYFLELQGRAIGNRVAEVIAKAF